jgi:hypothetical protein
MATLDEMLERERALMTRIAREQAKLTMLRLSLRRKLVRHERAQAHKMARVARQIGPPQHGGE